MDAIIAAVPWAGLGWTGIIIVGILSIIRGDLVPKTMHESITHDLRESLAVERDSNAKLVGALSLLANQYGTTTDRLLSALPLTPEQEAKIRDGDPSE